MNIPCSIFNCTRVYCVGYAGYGYGIKIKNNDNVVYNTKEFPNFLDEYRGLGKTVVYIEPCHTYVDIYTQKTALGLHSLRMSGSYYIPCKEKQRNMQCKKVCCCNTLVKPHVLESFHKIENIIQDCIRKEPLGILVKFPSNHYLASILCNTYSRKAIYEIRDESAEEPLQYKLIWFHSFYTPKIPADAWCCSSTTPRIHLLYVKERLNVILQRRKRPPGRALLREHWEKTNHINYILRLQDESCSTW